MLGRFIIFLLLVLPSTILLCGNGGHPGLLVKAEDPLEGEDDSATVETEEGAEQPEEPADSETGGDSAVTGKDAEEEAEPIKASPDVDTTVLFISQHGPTGDNRDIPSNKVIRLLIGLTNKGEKNFVVESMDGSFRYPQDFSFYVQNFSSVALAQTVEPKKQATFEYGFNINEAFNGRPFGLTIILNYKDSEGTQFLSAVYNETVMVVEPDEGLDGETFFLYLFLAAVCVLLIFGVHQLVTIYGKKRLLNLKPKKYVEMGTQNSDVDYEWIPKETLQGINRSPGRTPKQSPRQRKSKRSVGSGEE